MANNITIRQLNNGVYDSLLPRTTASKSYLTNDTSALYNLQNGTAEQAIQAIMRVIALSGNVSMRITDANGNPVVGAIVNGLVGSPISDENGNVQGIYEYTPVNIVSPYVDLQNKSVDVKNYIGSINVLTVRLDTYAENTVRRYTNSRNVRFSKMVKTVDVCCVGGGGGGGNLIITSSGGETYEHVSGGGGGGAIVNSYGKSINADTNYVLSIGSGGSSGYTGGTGGTTTFLSVSATGGGGAYVYRPDTSSSPIGKGGSAGSPGSGKGGDYGYNGENSTISEFDDGVTFYSGGGGSGDRKGGTPNGANGAYITGGYPNTSHPHSATTPGIGGGGGGATYDNQITANLPSAGGPGLVAIRLHFS